MILKILSLANDIVMVIVGWACMGVGFGWWDWWIAPKNETAVVLALLFFIGVKLGRAERDKD